MRIPPFPQVCSGLLCVLSILIAGCSNPSSQNLASLTVTATPSTVSVGGASVLKATAHLSDGTTQDVTSNTQWTLSNPALATLANGTVTAKAAGTVMVQAAYVEAAPAGTSPAAATTTPANLSASTQLTISASASTNTPAITWGTPAAIPYGTALSSTQLNATASVAGTFTYTPAAGTVLKAGTQTLSAVFTPTDRTYSAATATVQLTVSQATPTITWAALAPIATGTALSATQLDATANVPGAFVYNPAAGNVPAAGTLQLTATFTPTDTTDYASATAKNTLVVGSSNNPIQGIQGKTCPISAGASQATIQSALNSCGSGNTVVLAAGTYSIGSTLTLPCGVSLSGPVVPYSQTHNQTAIINGSFGVGQFGPIVTTAGCSASQSIQYLEWNGGRPNNGNLNPGGSGCLDQNNGSVPCGVGGGNFIYVTPGTQNLTITNNYIHGNYCGYLCADVHSTLIYLPPHGSQPGCCTFPSGYPVDDNINITWNILAAPGDCGPATVWSQNQNTEGGGGTCDGVALQGAFTNLNVSNNRFQTGDDELKFFEMYEAGNSAGYCNKCYFNYNDFQQYDRIAVEMQINWGGPSEPVLEYTQYNSFHNMMQPKQQDYDISQADGCAYNFNNVNETNCVSHVDYNVTVADTPTEGAGDAGYEFWAGTGSTANGNFWSGDYAYISLQWDPNGNYTFANDTVMAAAVNGNGGTNSSCGLLYANVNGSPYTTPTCPGSFNQKSNGTITSVAPVLSVSGNAVTITNTNVSTPNGSNPGRDSNTTFWCTTDGSAPVAGGAAASAGNTAQPYWAGAASQTVGTINTTGSGAVKCLGMWGAPNQPYSYVPVSKGGGGYVPSAVVSAAYGATATAVQPGAKVSSAITGTEAIAPAEAAGAIGAAAAAEVTSVAVVPAQTTVAIGSTTQLKAVATFGDGSTKDVTANFAWASSDTRTITATSSGLVSGLATGKATISGSYEGHQASVPAVSSIGQVDWSGPIVISEAGTYSGNWRSTDSKTPAVTVATTAPVVIESSHISGVAGLIKTTVAGADVTVRNSVALALNPAVKGQSNGVFLDASSPARLDVENNYVENAGGGVLVHGYSGNRDGQQTIVIRANRARNLNGLLSDGNGGYLPGVGSNRSMSDFIRLDKVQSVPGIDLGWNEVINYPGRSLVADNIDVKRSSGTPNQPLEIHDTYIQGAYPYTAAQTDYQGGGIKTEGSPDDSAQEATAFNNIHDNQVVGTVNYGIAFTAGHDNIAANNRVISSGRLADGTRIAAQYVGMANGDVNGASVANPSMYNNTMHDNLIGWTCWNSACSQSGYRKDQSFPASPADYSTNSVLAAQPITPQMENNEYQIWLNKTASAGVSVGPAF